MGTVLFPSFSNKSILYSIKKEKNFVSVDVELFAAELQRTHNINCLLADNHFAASDRVMHQQGAVIGQSMVMSGPRHY